LVGAFAAAGADVALVARFLAGLALLSAFLAALAGRPGAFSAAGGAVVSSMTAPLAPDLTEAMAFWAARLVV
jgi:hypothetical protein